MLQAVRLLGKQARKYIDLDMKILNNTINKRFKKTILKPRYGAIGKVKYFPSFTKEWRNTVYCYNKNVVKNIPANDVNINKIIRSYFNLYFKDHKFVAASPRASLGNSKIIKLKRKRKHLRKVYLSNAEIKHTNNKAIITLYTLNREKNILRKKYLAINGKLSRYLIRQSYKFYKKNLFRFYKSLNKALIHKNKYMFTSDIIRKKSFLKYKLDYLNKFLKLKHLYLRKIWSVLLRNYSRNYLSLSLLRKYDLLYSLNQYKFNKLKLLPILSNILRKITGKKIEYNIINLKHFAQHPDIFTNIVSLKLRKHKINVLNSIYSIINRAPLAPFNAIKEKSVSKGWNNPDPYLQKYRDLKIISHIEGPTNNLQELLQNNYSNTKKEIGNIVLNSIRYKNISGIKLQVSGRLTKRYRADRAISSLKWRGGLKNIDASYKRMTTVLFRGNQNSNVLYSWSKSKRRIGSFAVKGWIGTK